MSITYDGSFVGGTILPTGRVGVDYSFTLEAVVDGLEWSATQGVLPVGIALDPSGVLAGRPVASGTFPVTFVGTDGVNPDTTVLAVLSINAANLITVDDLASYLQQGFPAGDTASQDAVDYATAVVQAWCRRPLVARDGDTYTTTGGSRIRLPITPVRSVSSVLVDSVETLTNWELRNDGSILWVGSSAAPTSTNAVDITYSNGFLDTDFKVQVARAVAIRLAARLYQNPLDRGTFSGPEGLQYSPSAGVSARLLTGDEQMMLASLRDVEGFA